MTPRSGDVNRKWEDLLTKQKTNFQAERSASGQTDQPLELARIAPRLQCLVEDEVLLDQAWPISEERVVEEATEPTES